MITWLDPAACDPPHAVTHEDKLELLIDSLRNGWNGPALLGYRLRRRIQLISGSHRWAASAFLERTLPVEVMSYSYVRGIYGTPKWLELMVSAPMVCQ